MHACFHTKSIKLTYMALYSTAIWEKAGMCTYDLWADGIASAGRIPFWGLVWSPVFARHCHHHLSWISLGLRGIWKQLSSVLVTILYSR